MSNTKFPLNVRSAQVRPGLMHLTSSAVLALLVSAGVQQAGAAVPEWPADPYRYIVVDQDLRTVLEEFGRNTGVRVALSEGVQGRVRGNLPQVPPGEFLEAVAKSYGLDWYFDGAVLHVSTTGEAGTRFIDLRGLSFSHLAAGLGQAGVTDPRFVLREGPSPGTVMVSGPPRYLQLVVEAAAAMAGEKATPVAALAVTPVRVFRGSVAPR